MAELDAEVIIDGVHYEEYLVRLERTESLATPGSEITFTFSPDIPHTSILPWQSLVVYEQGVKTLTGFVQNIIPKRGPAEVTVKGSDTYARAQTWFMPENLFTSGSQTIGYWINYFCNECGISYSINDATGAAIVLNADIPFGLRLVSDALVNLCAVAQWQMQIDANGVLQFNHIGYPATPEFRFTQVESYEYELNDLDTRNRVVVWGFQNSNGGSIIYTNDRVVPGIPAGRNMVYAEPNISTYAQAETLGEAALDQWAKLEQVLATEVIGNPSVRVGDAVSVDTSYFTSGSYLDTVTDMQSVLDQSGYNQNITAGRRAYRYPYWPVGGTPFTGNPTIDWEYESVIGEARNLWLLPGRNVFYVGGWTHINQSSGSSRCWRLECRNLSSGSLIWGQDTTDTGTAGGPTGLCQINGVYSDSSGVYVTGFDQMASRWRTERYNFTGGSSTWAYTEVGTGSDIAGDVQNLYIISRDTDALNVFPATSPSLIRKLDHSGNLITAVSPVRGLLPPPFTGLNTNLKVYNFNHINLQSDGLYLSGLFDVGGTFSPVYLRYVCKYSLVLGKVWENMFIPGEGEGDVGDPTTPATANSITSVVLATGGPIYAFTRLENNTPPRIRGVWHLSLGGGYISTSGSIDGTNAVDGNGYQLFIISNQGTSLIGFDKSSQTAAWTLTPGPTYNGIRYLNYAGKLYVCGRKNSNFYVARYGV